MEISVVVATFNGEKYLAEQLDSIDRQTRLPDEIVICDDRSDDNTVKIAEEFSKSSNVSVKIIQNQENIGYTKNFFRGLEFCQGDLVLLSDQDDIWFENKVDHLVEIAEAEPKTLMFVHDGEFITATGCRTGLTKIGQVRAGYGRIDGVLTGALTMVRRELLLFAIPVPDNIVGHDIWIESICALFGDRKTVLEDCLQFIRRHESNNSDWVVNSSRKISSLDVIKSQITSQPAKSYSNRLALNRELLARSELVFSSTLYEGDYASANATRKILENERDALKKREKLLSENSLKRRLSALKMLASRQYIFFNGVKSFLRDMLR